MFVVNGIDHKPIHPVNFIDKYADDSYLIVSSNHESTIDDELAAIERWALKNNLSLNKTKSVEIIFYPTDVARKSASVVRPIPNIKRDNLIKILGVTFHGNLSIKIHVSNVAHTTAQSLYALKLLKAHGLDQASLRIVCNAIIISRLTYAAPSWWGYRSTEDEQKLDSVINRAKRWGFYNQDAPTLNSICTRRENDLFVRLISNPSHLLHQLLPPLKNHPHFLRPRSHDRQLPPRGVSLHSKSFIQRMLFTNIY